MKAISIKQPYASLIVTGVKMIENRSWLPKYRGKLAILSSSRMSKSDLRFCESECERLGLDFPAFLPLGGIVGVVKFVGWVQDQGGEIVTDDPTNLPDEIDLEWYNSPSIGWVFIDPYPVEFVKHKGKLGLFDVPDELIKYT